MSFNWKRRMQLENAKKCFIYLIFWSETLSGKWNECKYFKCDLAAKSGSVGGKTSPITVSDGSSLKNTLPLHLNSSDGVCWVLLRSKQRNAAGKKREGMRSCCKGKSCSRCYYSENDELNRNRTNGRQSLFGGTTTVRATLALILESPIKSICITFESKKRSIWKSVYPASDKYWLTKNKIFKTLRSWFTKIWNRRRNRRKHHWPFFHT